MAYPGNLHALVARDQHLTCKNANEYVLHKENDDGTPTEKLRSGRGRRSRRKPRTALEAVADRTVGIDLAARADRCGGSSSQVARGGRISPCDYAKLMDHGSFGLRPALQIPTVRARRRELGVIHGD